MASEGSQADELFLQRQAFLKAIGRYERVPAFKRLENITSLANVSLQVWLVIGAAQAWSHPLAELAAFVAALLVADFLNGVVHLVMDHASGYRSAIGPLVANFHLHHRIPVYRRRSLPVVYFRESGTKFWLVAYLAAVAWFLPGLLAWSPAVAHFLVLVGVLSSWAEVSHYMCHTTHYRFQPWLEKIGLGLSKAHHAHHHAEDNVGYAFLNGWSDPFLNVLARWLGSGYKNGTDLHDDLYDIRARA
jgi:hypothetical protein